MAFHAAAHSDAAFEQAQQFAHVPDTEMNALAAKQAQNHEKKALKKARQKAKKAEAAAEAAAEAQRAKEEAEAAEDAARREAKIQMDPSIAAALKEKLKMSMPSPSSK